LVVAQSSSEFPEGLMNNPVDLEPAFVNVLLEHIVAGKNVWHRRRLG
jgi:hypothetical protein